MGVRPGFKQTEIGVIPEDWDPHAIAELAEVDPENLSASTDPNYSFNYISLEQVDAGRLLSVSPQIFRSAPSRARRVLRHDDVLMSTVRPNLKAHLHFRSQVPNAICSTGFAVLRAKPSVAESAYIFAHLFAYTVNKQIEQTLAGSNYPAISGRDVRRLVIPCPPTVEEQRAIATALSDVDALLDGLDRLIAKKRDLKQAAMQQLLTSQIRLPGFHREWEVKRLDELGAWKGGMTPSMQNPAFWYDGDIPWISSGDVKTVVLRSTGFSVTSAAIEQGTTILVPPGTIVVVTRSGILRRHLPVAMTTLPMAINQDIKALIPRSSFNALFLLYRLLHEGDRILSGCMKAGTTVESIEFRWLKAFTVTIPHEIAEQTAIAAVLSDMDAEIEALEARRSKTRDLKQAMMQELLTGRIRLVQPEAAHA